MATLYSSQYDTTTGKTINTQSESPVNFNTPLNVADLTNTGNINVPTNNGNPYAGLGSSTVLTPPPTYTPPPTPTAEDKYASDLAGLPQAQSQEQLQAELDKKYNIEQKTQTANALKAQIDTNTAEALSAQQTLESQAGGKDVTSAFLGRQQQEIDRQLAIKNLPLTAQYQASLGDLQGAQASVEKLFTAKTADAEAQYKYKKDLIDSAYTVASAKEKKLLDAKKIKEDQKFETEKQLNTYKQTIAKSLIENGQAKLLTNLGNATTQAEVDNIASQITTKTTPKTEIVKKDDGSQILIDSNTGKIIASYGAGTDTTKSNAQLSLVNDINNVLADPSIDSVFGVSNYLSRTIPGTPAYTAASNVNNIIQQAALAARGQLKGQGTVSDFEGKMLKGAQTALKLNMNAEDAKKSLAKLRGAVVTSSGGSASVKITDKNGVSKLGIADQKMITDAIGSGYRVEYQ